MKRVLKQLSIALLISSGVAYAANERTPEEIEVYHELLENAAETHLLEILAEGAKRDFPLPKNIKPLWDKPLLRAVLLESLSLEECDMLNVFDAANFTKMSQAEQSAVLLRCNHEDSWKMSPKTLSLGEEVYSQLGNWAKNLVLSQHLDQKSDQLLKTVSAINSKSDHEKKYIFSFKKSFTLQDLRYQKGDSSLIIQTKLSHLSKLKPADKTAVVKQYKGLGEPIKLHIIPYLTEAELLDLLKKSKHDPTRAAALKALLSIKWAEGQMMRVIKSKAWAEGYELYNYLCEHPERINAASFEKYWKASKELGKTMLSAFLWQHPKKEVSKTLIEHLDKAKDKEIALKGLHALPAHGKSDWLRKHVASKKWDDNLRAMAIDTLWEWKEIAKPGEEFYLKIFLEQGYRNGGPGVESLLKLVGLSKNRKAPKIISSFFREVEEPIVEVDVAIEAAGWHGSKEFLRTLQKMERDGNDTPVLTWAIARCKGENLPFPEAEPVDYNNVNPYFFDRD